MHVCPRCQGERLVKNGSAAGKPKKQCKQCGYQFTRTTPRGKPLAIKINAVLWYLSGVAMNRIACLLRISAQAVLAEALRLSSPFANPSRAKRAAALQRTRIHLHQRRPTTKSDTCSEHILSHLNTTDRYTYGMARRHCFDGKELRGQSWSHHATQCAGRRRTRDDTSRACGTATPPPSRES
jgi:hypothetical protein